MPTSTDAPRRSFSRPAHRVDTHDACDPTAATTTHRRRCAVPCDDLAWGVMVNVQEEAPAPVDPEMEEAERKKLVDEKRREKLQYKVKLRMSAAFEKKTIPWSSVFVVAMGLLALLSHAYFNHVIRVRLPTLRAPPCLPPSIHAGSTARRLRHTRGRDDRRAQLRCTWVTRTRRVPSFSRPLPPSTCPDIYTLGMPSVLPTSSTRRFVRVGGVSRRNAVGPF